VTAADRILAWQKIAALRQNSNSAVLIGLADTAKVNGASKAFIDAIGPQSLYAYVDAYAGWNTAGNSLGTVLAHLLFLEKGQAIKGPCRATALEAHRALQRLRLVDDYFFQSQVRAEFVSWALGNGFSYLTFGDRWAEANARLQILMEEALAPYPDLATDLRLRTMGKNGTYHFSFPWPRSFELRIEAV